MFGRVQLSRERWTRTKINSRTTSIQFIAIHEFTVIRKIYISIDLLQLQPFCKRLGVRRISPNFANIVLEWGYPWVVSCLIGICGLAFSLTLPSFLPPSRPHSWLLFYFVNASTSNLPYLQISPALSMPGIPSPLVVPCRLIVGNRWLAAMASFSNFHY